MLHQWAALGEYDFVNIVEAPDDLTIAKVSVALGARGSAKLESLPLIAVDDLLSSSWGSASLAAAARKPVERGATRSGLSGSRAVGSRLNSRRDVVRRRPGGRARRGSWIWPRPGAELELAAAVGADPVLPQ